jgi:hypothetical protein
MDFFSNPNIHSVVTERVKCAFAPATKDGEYGTHYVVLMRDKKDNLLYVSCECEEGHGTALIAGMDTEEGDTCFSYVSKLRSSISGVGKKHHGSNPHYDHNGNQTMLSRVVYALGANAETVRTKRKRQTSGPYFGNSFTGLSEQALGRALALSRAVERVTDTAGRYLVVPWATETKTPDMSIPEGGHLPTYTVHTCQRGEFKRRPLLAFINNEWRIRKTYVLAEWDRIAPPDVPPPGAEQWGGRHEWGVPFPKDSKYIDGDALSWALENLAESNNSLTVASKTANAGGRCQICRKNYDRISRHINSATHLKDVFNHLVKITKLIGSSTQLHSLNKFGSSKLIKKRPTLTGRKNNRYHRPEYIQQADHYIVVAKNQPGDNFLKGYGTNYRLNPQETSLIKMGLVNKATELYYGRTGFTEGEARGLIEDYIKLTT